MAVYSYLEGQQIRLIMTGWSWHDFCERIKHILVIFHI